MSNICAVIPAYNAERTIKILIERVKKFIPLEDIVVVDDGSTDMTSEIALGCGANVFKAC